MYLSECNFLEAQPCILYLIFFFLNSPTSTTAYKECINLLKKINCCCKRKHNLILYTFFIKLKFVFFF